MAVAPLGRERFHDCQAAAAFLVGGWRTKDGYGSGTIRHLYEHDVRIEREAAEKCCRDEPRARRGADRRQRGHAVPHRDGAGQAAAAHAGAADLYGAPEPLRSDLLELARGADDQGWLRQYQSALPGEYSAYISFEAEARSVRNYESLFIPGLLQTEDYARAVISGVWPTATATVVEQLVQARLDRQQLLSGDEPLELWAVIDEAVVRRLVGGPKVMQAQVARCSITCGRRNLARTKASASYR